MKFFVVGLLIIKLCAEIVISVKQIMLIEKISGNSSENTLYKRAILFLLKLDHQRAIRQRRSEVSLKFLKENGYPVDLVIKSTKNITAEQPRETCLHEIFVNGIKIDSFHSPVYDRRLYAIGFFKAWGILEE